MQFHSYGGPEVLQPAEENVGAPDVGMIRVRQHTIGVNPADLVKLSGRFGRDGTLPGVLGFEASGVVDAIGPGVDGFTVGAPVLWHGPGTEREVALVPADRVHIVPSTIDLDQAALLPVAGATAFSAVLQANVGPGTVLLVHGAAGGVGSATVQIAAALGARVIGTASVANQDYVHSLGAVPLVYGQGLTERVRRLPGGLHDVNAVVDVVGTNETVNTTITLLTGEPGATLTAGNDRAVVVASSAAAHTAGIADVRPHRGALPEVIALAETGLLHTEISRVFPLARAADALRSMTGHTRGKTVLHTALADA